MNITVNLYAAARHAAQCESVTVSAATLNELRQALVTQLPALEPIIPQCSMLVDGHSYGRDGDTELVTDARVDVMPPFSGG